MRKDGQYGSKGMRLGEKDEEGRKSKRICEEGSKRRK